MNIGQIFTSFGTQIEAGCAGIILAVILPRIVAWIKSTINTEIDQIEAAGLATLKGVLDPEWLDILGKVVAKLQKDADSPDFLAKITALKGSLKSVIKGNVDDVIIDAIFDTIYSRLKGK